MRDEENQADERHADLRFHVASANCSVLDKVDGSIRSRGLSYLVISPDEGRKGRAGICSHGLGLARSRPLSSSRRRPRLCRDCRQPIATKRAKRTYASTVKRQLFFKVADRRRLGAGPQTPRITLRTSVRHYGGCVKLTTADVHALARGKAA
jgi:hypothetical protein